jgi:hypothetical protein
MADEKQQDAKAQDLEETELTRDLEVKDDEDADRVKGGGVILKRLLTG